MSTTMIQLHTTIPVETSKGKGLAIGWIDYSEEHHLLWIVALDSNGQVWTLPNTEIRLQKNITMGRTNVELPEAKLAGDPG